MPSEERLVPLAGKPCDLCFLARSQRLARVHGLYGNGLLARLRLATLRFCWFVTRSRAPSHGRHLAWNQGTSPTSLAHRNGLGATRGPNQCRLPVSRTGFCASDRR